MSPNTCLTPVLLSSQTSSNTIGWRFLKSSIHQFINGPGPAALMLGDRLSVATPSQPPPTDARHAHGCTARRPRGAPTAQVGSHFDSKSPRPGEGQQQRIHSTCTKLQHGELVVVRFLCVCVCTSNVFIYLMRTKTSSDLSSQMQ